MGYETSQISANNWFKTKWVDIISLIQSEDFNQKVGTKIPLTIHMNIHIKQAVQRLHRVKFV